MLANNETGVLQPITQAAALCRRHGALLHVDAVQAAGRMPVDLAALGADSLAVSSHKLGGPQGAGALLLAPSLATIAPLIVGGGQERGRRGGTPALPAIAGFAAAAAVSPADQGRLARLRDAVESAALAAGAVPVAAAVPRLANTACLALPGVRADAQVIALDLAGFAVSAGAACSSGKVAASHVLAAMGLGALAGQAIRVSLPWDVRDADVQAFAAAYAGMAARLRPALAAHPG
jgi:cysteine desulfurase